MGDEGDSPRGGRSGYPRKDISDRGGPARSGLRIDLGSSLDLGIETQGSKSPNQVLPYSSMLG